jgi:hypothetical protein
VRPGESKKLGWAIEEILMVADENLGQARRLFREEYGVLPDHKSIDIEIAKRFEWALNSEPPSVVELPRHIVLALTLREGFAGRGRGRKLHWSTLREVQAARKRKVSLITDGMKSGEAEEQAAQEAIERLRKRGYYGVNLKRLQRLMESDK